MHQPVPLNHAYRLLNHGPTVLVSAAHGGRRNVMAAAWNTIFEFQPPRIGVVIDKSTYTRELVEAAGRFAIGVPCRAIADLAYTVGSTSGREGDKFERFGIGHFPGSAIDVPLVEGCVAWLECRVIPEPHVQQAYDLFVAEVLVAQADPRAFRDGRWHFDDPALATIHHLGGGQFVSAGSPWQARMLGA